VAFNSSAKTAGPQSGTVLPDFNKRRTSMKRNIALRTLLMVFVAAFFASTAATAQAKGKDPQCTLAGAAGTYGFSDSGTVVGVGPRAAAGILTLDALGNINGKVTASLNGSVTHTTLSGTYTVNPDCTGAGTFEEFDQSGNKTLTLTEDAVWDDNMQEVRSIVTSAVLPNGTALATVITVDGRKLFPESSNQQ
jgi:hypothetical protein